MYLLINLVQIKNKIYNNSFLISILLLFTINKSYSQNNDCILNKSDSCFKSLLANKLNLIIEQKIIYSDSVNVTQTPLLADIDNDCIPEIITSNYSGTAILIFDTRTRILKKKIKTPTIDLFLNGIAIADINNDKVPEIFIETAPNGNPINLRRRLVSLDVNGNILWVSNQRVDNFLQFQDEFGGTPAIADFNQDGNPEIYVNNKIFNSLTGVLLLDGGSNGLGTMRLTNFSSDALSIAAQLDDDFTDLELAAGYTIYKVKINNLNGNIGNTIIPANIMIDGMFLDGFTTIGDINIDGKLDVIVTSPGLTNQAVVYIYDLINGNTNLIAKAYPSSDFYEGIGPALVGNLVGMLSPSIVFTRYKTIMSYNYNGTNILQLNWSLITDDTSGSTGLTLFDFNNDGIQEVVYRDESDLQIINGKSGGLYPFGKFKCFSLTGSENPIVGDFENNGQAKICVICGIQPDNIIGKLTIFGSPDSLPGWAPARGIWNQYNYHVLNVNDDLTIPRVQKNNATYKNGKYNNFYVQESLVDSNGYYKRPAASLFGMMDCIQYDPLTDLYSVDFSLFNKKNASHAADSGLSVAFYNGNPELGAPLLGIYHTGQTLAAGDSLLNLVFRFSASGLKHLFMVINTQRNASGSFNDADFIFNNAITLIIFLVPSSCLLF